MPLDRETANRRFQEIVSRTAHLEPAVLASSGDPLYRKPARSLSHAASKTAGDRRKSMLERVWRALMTVPLVVTAGRDAANTRQRGRAGGNVAMPGGA